MEETNLSSIKASLASLEKNIDDFKECREFSRKNVYLVPFFNFLFYFGFFPYKLEFDKSADKYVPKSYKSHRILCGISHASTLSFMSYFTTLALYNLIKKDSSKQVVAINVFDIASNIGLVANSTFIAHMSWRKKTLFLEMIEMSRVKCFSAKRLRVICALVYISSVLLIIFFGLMEWVLLTHYSGLGQSSTSKNGHNSTSENDQESFLTLVGSIEISVDDNQFIACLKRFGTGIIVVTYVYLTLFYSVCQAVFMALALTLRQVGREFRKKLRADGYLDDGEGLKQGLQLYKNLKRTMDLVKSVFGNALIGYYIAAVAYLAEAPHVLLGNRGEFERLIMLYSAISTIVWIISAEFHHNVRTALLNWTEYHSDNANISTDDRLRLLAICNEISSNDTTTVALSNKCFSVTYKHISTMVGLIVTYGIIVFQLHYGYPLGKDSS